MLRSLPISFNTIRCLVLLGLANVCLALLFYLYLLLNTVNSNSQDFAIYEQSFTDTIDQYAHVPDLLANNQLFMSLLTDTPLAGNNASVSLANARLSLVSELSGADEAYIMNTRGVVIATSNADTPDSFLGNNYGFRPYFYLAIKYNKKQYYYAKGATTGIPGFFIASPIHFDGQLKGVAVLKLNLQHREKSWQQSGRRILVSDENNITLLTSNPSWRYKTTQPLDSQTLSQIEQLQQFPEEQHPALTSRKINLRPLIDADVWEVDQQYFIANRFSIDTINWHLYYLVEHWHIVKQVLLFLLITSVVSLMAYRIVIERRNKKLAHIASEVSENKRREDLQNIVDNIHVGVIIFDRHGYILSMNNHVKQLILHKAKKIRNISQLMDVTLNELLIFSSNRTESGTYRETVLRQTNINYVPIMYTISPINTMDQDAYLMTFVNITRRKKAEHSLVKLNANLEEQVNQRTQELKQAQNKLIQKNKTVALGNMTATIVHEINQPLTAMSSSIAAMVSKIEQKNWQGAVASSNRLTSLYQKMNNILKKLKVFSYPHSESTQAIELNTEIEHIVDRFKDVFEQSNIVLSEHYDEKDNWSIIPLLKLDLVISNILHNALDALGQSNKKVIDVAVNHQPPWAVISISDNAGGIDPKVLDTMFNPYFTTKEVGKGVGLGLAITYEIIQEYEGEIAASNNTEGAHFVIRLPLSSIKKHPTEKTHD